MDSKIITLESTAITSFTDLEKQTAIEKLEAGAVLFFPNMTFPVYDEEQCLLSENLVSGKRKNISFDPKLNMISGSKVKRKTLPVLKNFISRYADFSRDLVDNLLPNYQERYVIGRTSFRPVEIKDRPSSYRKDDSRLHVDAFVSSPVLGWRILRIFSNINPHNKPRVWHIGEPFEQVAQKFLPTAKNYQPMVAHFLKKMKVTKAIRSPYDHYMLQMHDKMKGDDTYQQTVDKIRFDFPPNSVWIVFTDQVSHAALEGQFVLEQTFNLPVTAMQEPEKSPLKTLERIKGCELL